MQRCGTIKNQLEIILEILSVCKKPQNQNKLKQQIDIELEDLQYCLNQLQELSLVEVHPHKLEYYTSHKGQSFFEKCIQLQKILTSEEKLSIKLSTKS